MLMCDKKTNQTTKRLANDTRTSLSQYAALAKVWVWTEAHEIDRYEQDWLIYTTSPAADREKIS